MTTELVTSLQIPNGCRDEGGGLSGLKVLLWPVLLLPARPQNSCYVCAVSPQAGRMCSVDSLVKTRRRFFFFFFPLSSFCFFFFNIILFLFFLSICLFKREREKEHEMVEGQREKQTPC